MSNQPHPPNYTEGLPLLGGRYQITGQLGAGGFGQTFLAQDRHRPGYPECVVKQLKPQVSSAEELQVARRLFETEARVLSELGDHPQIPRLLAHFEENQEFYLAQDLVRGHSLEFELSLATQPAARWSEAIVISFLGDLLNTLEFVHEQQVIHRDIKPSNLIRRELDSRLVLIDFGSVKQVTTQLTRSQSSLGRTISIGTRGYMPSEQVAGRPHFSSDIYAVGMIAIQGLTQRHPSTLPIDPETGEISWWTTIPHIHPALKTFLDTMVRYDFRARFPTASVALSALNCLPSELSQFTTLAAEEYAHLGSNSSDYYPADPTRTLSLSTQTLLSPTMAKTVAVSSQAGQADSSQADLSLQTHKPAAPSTPASSRNVLLPFGLAIGTVAIFSTGLLAWRNNISEPAVSEPTVSEPAVQPDRPVQTGGFERVEQPLEQPSIDGGFAPEPESIPESTDEPTPRSTSDITEEPTPNPEEAIALVETLYSDISSQSWNNAVAVFSEDLAPSFSREFFERFERVTVENLVVVDQTEEALTLTGHNTYVYPNGEIQREERTFILETIDGQPRIVDSRFVRVIKARNKTGQ
ncbi:serine/threonine-protein kinase [cf. Phormidesmis sp. LEGE 11477]|uniref:serine/threonine-protein kinase n=1 Tax=cf. Phormidesmis sp. LEGE 11477 TaxID=1828680 RepID=UPI00187E7ED4|nr:serine/threonine-protein kinase [cf. Phormidesmis sp. LEGE 11477]MBE9060162.1 protein kinase [cf. Phormidesmis sp. LEGE 11477]